MINISAWRYGTESTYTFNISDRYIPLQELVKRISVKLTENFILLKFDKGFNGVDLEDPYWDSDITLDDYINMYKFKEYVDLWLYPLNDP
jgi:hypothetical protein